MIEEVTDVDKTKQMMARFEGYASAYGTYNAAVPTLRKGGKLEIKSSARTIRAPLTYDLWRQHLTGERPLGVIPIRADNTCLWGAIDIDIYDIEPTKVMADIDKHNFPLVTCRTKSGGLHLYLFLSSPAPAAEVQRALREMAATMGYGGSEVYPKQVYVNLDSGDLGSWLNMPYFGGDESDRYAVKDKGGSMTVTEFLHLATAKEQPAAYVLNSFRAKQKTDPEFGDGPPCLQHLASVGVGSGSRNAALFAFGIFAKKKYPSNWVDQLEAWNRNFFDPPLPSAEVVSIVKGHETKDYNYPCRQSPIQQHCNSSLCRTRRFGVGAEDDYPTISNLQKMTTDPPLWFMDVNGQRLELMTEEIQNYKSFHRVCMERLDICFRMMKTETWFALVAAAMKECTTIDAPEDVGERGRFQELLEDFLVNKFTSTQKSDLLAGRPYLDEETNRLFFRLRDLQDHLEKSNFKIYSRAQMTVRIKSLGGDRQFFNIDGRGVNCWWVHNMFAPPPKLPLAALPGSVI